MRMRENERNISLQIILVFFFLSSLELLSRELRFRERGYYDRYSDALLPINLLFVLEIGWEDDTLGSLSKETEEEIHTRKLIRRWKCRYYDTLTSAPRRDRRSAS